MEKAIGDEEILGYNPPEISKGHSVFSLVINRSFEPVTGDAFFGGIEVQNSLDGERCIEIAPFVFRQFCANGMIVSENIGRFKRLQDENFDLWAQGSTRRSLQQIDSTFTRIRKLTEVGVEDNTENTLRSIFVKFQIPTKIQKEIVGEPSDVTTTTSLISFETFNSAFSQALSTSSKRSCSFNLATV